VDWCFGGPFVSSVARNVTSIATDVAVTVNIIILILIIIVIIIIKNQYPRFLRR